MVWNRTRRPSPVVRSTAAVVAALAMAGVPARAANPAAPECGEGRWVVAGMPLLDGPTPQGDDVIALEAGNVGIASGCLPTIAKVRGHRRTIVRARWETCGNLQRVRLTARIAAGCDEMRGTFAANGQKRRRFSATLSRCANGCGPNPSSPTSGCGDGVCDGTESYASCPADCASWRERTWIIDGKTGNDSGSGHAGAPWRTWGKLILALNAGTIAPGDHVLIRPGRYAACEGQAYWESLRGPGGTARAPITISVDTSLPGDVEIHGASGGRPMRQLGLAAREAMFLRIPVGRRMRHEQRLPGRRDLHHHSQRLLHGPRRRATRTPGKAGSRDRGSRSSPRSLRWAAHRRSTRYSTPTSRPPGLRPRCQPSRRVAISIGPIRSCSRSAPPTGCPWFCCTGAGTGTCGNPRGYVQTASGASPDSRGQRAVRRRRAAERQVRPVAGQRVDRAEHVRPLHQSRRRQGLGTHLLLLVGDDRHHAAGQRAPRVLRGLRHRLQLARHRHVRRWLWFDLSSLHRRRYVSPQSDRQQLELWPEKRRPRHHVPRRQDPRQSGQRDGARQQRRDRPLLRPHLRACRVRRRTLVGSQWLVEHVPARATPTPTR